VWKLFDGLMRVISSLLGLAMIAIGGIWMLQGLNLAFRVGFMVGDRHWTVYGALLALAGVGELIWSNRRQRPH
jgi:drug/metabolite transporter superfamily protein YnfA